MRWRPLSKPTCRFAKLVSDRQCPTVADRPIPDRQRHRQISTKRTFTWIALRSEAWARRGGPAHSESRVLSRKVGQPNHPSFNPPTLESLGPPASLRAQRLTQATEYELPGDKATDQTEEGR